MSAPPIRIHPPASNDYPAALRALPKPPALHVAGEMQPRPTVAIVGTREPCAEARAFASELAREVVLAGGNVVSGGAVGIDSAAHEGALSAGGFTWVVAATGPDEVYPKSNRELFRRVPEEGGAMIWPFPEGTRATPLTFFARNGALVALSHAVVVVQAGVPSGALNAARWARRLVRPLWTVVAPPWMGGFEGCGSILELGGRPLVSKGALFRSVGLRLKESQAKKASRKRQLGLLVAAVNTPAPRVPLDLDPQALEVLGVLRTSHAQHVDEIATKSGLKAPVVSTALLTLALENVVVEGPEGFFRLATTR